MSEIITPYLNAGDVFPEAYKTPYRELAAVALSVLGYAEREYIRYGIIPGFQLKSFVGNKSAVEATLQHYVRPAESREGCGERHVREELEVCGLHDALVISFKAIYDHSRRYKNTETFEKRILTVNSRAAMFRTRTTHLRDGRPVVLDDDPIDPSYEQYAAHLEDVSEFVYRAGIL